MNNFKRQLNGIISLINGITAGVGISLFLFEIPIYLPITLIICSLLILINRILNKQY